MPSSQPRLEREFWEILSFKSAFGSLVFKKGQGGRDWNVHVTASESWCCDPAVSPASSSREDGCPGYSLALTFIGHILNASGLPAGDGGGSGALEAGVQEGADPGLCCHDRYIE